MRDPTHEEMTEFLATQTCGEDMSDEIEVAIYWFAMYWHGGQSSNLYSVLSTSPYHPGMDGMLEGESDTVQHMFDALEAGFRTGGPTCFKTRTDHVRRGPEDHEQGSELDPIRHGALT